MILLNPQLPAIKNKKLIKKMLKNKKISNKIIKYENKKNI